MPNTLTSQLRPAKALTLPGARRSPERGLDAVMVGSDGSGCAERALTLAEHLAVRAGCELHVFHDERTEPVATHLHRSGTRPGDAMVEAMSAQSLLVLGARGRRTGMSLGIGSLAREMVCRAPSAVVVVGGTPLAAGHGVITVGIGDGDATPLLRWACLMAKLTSSRLDLMHAVATARPVDRDRGTRLLAEAFRTLRSINPTIVARAELYSGYPHEAIARRRESDLLVLGPGSCRDGHPSQVTMAGLHHAACPVLVAHA